MSEQVNSKKDGLALITAGVFVLALVFLSYRYFNSNNQISTEETNETQLTVVTAEEEQKGRIEQLRDLLSSKLRGDQEITEDAASDTITEENEEMNPSSSPENELVIDTEAFIAKRTAEGNILTGTQTTQANTQQLSQPQEWVANDYNKGDITGESYTVQDGDTLWEIAEGRYGNGADWGRILEANSNSIGYLASGQQALITAGQILVLP